MAKTEIIPQANELCRISKGTKITGVMTSTADIRIDGTFDGTVYTKGKLVIGEAANIKGKIFAQSCDVWGHVEVGNADVAVIASESAFALGCPSMGAEQLEESEMEPFVQELEPLAAGKTILLFGSYGWGDGEWMREWAERMENAGAVLLRKEGIIVNEAPDEEALAACRAAGKELAGKAAGTEAGPAGQI